MHLSWKFWIHIPIERAGKGEASKTTPLQNIIEKKTMINLVSHVFSPSQKNMTWLSNL